jgi:lysyl-tRNA synthetase class 2
MQPSQLERVRFRAAVESAIRDWFQAQGVLHVSAPTLVPSPGMEPHLRAFATRSHECAELGPRWLHTSPEYAIKQVLHELDCDVWCMARCYRDEPPSRWHHVEFTMIEWYRQNVGYEALMQDCESLLRHILTHLGWEQTVTVEGHADPVRMSTLWKRVTVADAFRAAAQMDVFETDPRRFAEAARRAGVDVDLEWDWATTFSVVYSLVVEPWVCSPQPAFLCDFPVSEAALSRARPDDARVAERFELYVPLPVGADVRGNLELANAFTELVDAAEQRRRFESEMAWRHAQGLVVYPMPEAMLQGLANMKPTAGIALGLERLLVWLAQTWLGWETGVADFLPSEPLAGAWRPAERSRD